jgi:membrane-associated phospholipid phosphatase
MTIRFWRRPENIHPKAIDPFYGFLVIAEGLAINGLLSEFLKTYVGKKRPNFFAMCNYHGYNDAILTNNFTYYFAHTDANRFGSTANCWDQTSFAIVQGRSSFPSGHATYAFCGYTLWSLLSVYVWHCITKGHKAFKVLYFLVFMLIALVLSWSRALDYWHTPSDIFAGAAIGGIVGSLVFLLNYSFSTVDKLKKNLERDIRTVKNEDPESATKEATKQDNSVKNMSKKLNKTDQNTAKDKSDQYINYTYT